MYENEIYSNSENGGYTSYQTGSAYNTIYNPVAAGDDGKKKKKGTFRKFVISMGLGITFGAFAGAGFYAVHLGAGRLLPANQEVISTETSQGENLPGDAKMDSINYVTYVSDDISNVVASVMPAMVSIVNTSTRTTSFWGYTYQQSLPSAGSGIIVEEKDGITIEVPDPNHIVIHGADKQKVGQFAAEVREKRPPEPYKGKGIKYADEVIRRKEGKTGVKK